MRRSRRAAFLVGLAAAAGAPAGQAASSPLEPLTNSIIYGGGMEAETISGFEWSPDGSRLAFLRESSPDEGTVLQVRETATGLVTPLSMGGEGGESPPSIASARWVTSGSLLATAEGDLYLFTLSGRAGAHTCRRLTRTESAEKDARPSPDGKQVGFVRDHDLHVLDLGSGAERRLTGGDPEGVLNGEIDWVYEEEFGISSGWWWSPDSRRIAYLQLDERFVPQYPIVDWIPVHPTIEWQRYPKAGDPNPLVRVAILTAGGPEQPTRWLDLGAERDIYVPRVAWTADSSALAVQRLDRDQSRLDLLLYDAAGGPGRLLLSERASRWINVNDDWKLIGGRGDGRLIWGSERDGWRHLYLYALDGTLIRRLTEGPWAVTSLEAVNEVTQWVYFSGTQASAAQRQLYRVRLDGSGFARLTQEPGWHAVTVSPAGLYVDSHSDVMTPPAVSVRDVSGRTLATLDAGLAAKLQGYRRGRAEFRQVSAADGTSLPAMMILPPDFDPKRRYPVIVYVYGGPHAQVVIDSWRGSNGLWHQMMAARGFIIWSLDNRGMGGRGHAWEAPVHRDMGRQELADQLEGVAYLRSLPYVDDSRIGIWGWSYGGYMTLYALLSSPDTFRAGVSVAPVTHWRSYDTIYTERYMERPSDNPDGYRDSAPLEKAAALKAPLLLVHGSSDDNVHLQNSIQMLDAFVKAGRPVDFMLYPRKSHGITGREARTHLFEKITRFFEQHLGSRG